MDILRKLLLALSLAIAFSSCSNAAEKVATQQAAIGKGVQKAMKTYYIGRFAIDLPEEFKLEMQSQKLRYAEVSDFRWGSGDREKERESLWAQKIAEIKKLPKPAEKNTILIEEMDMPSLGKWAKGALYYGDYLHARREFYTILVDYGETGAWLTIGGTNKEKMVKNFTNILTHYKYGHERVANASFYLRHGEIMLPYLEQEKTYARYEGPMGMVLKVDMNEIHKAPEREGIIDRTVAAMATGFASGLDIIMVRSGKRTAAGLAGEEEILQGDDGTHKNVSFDWEYLGSVESGEQPRIQITVDTKNDNMNEKVIVWDKVLNSFRSVVRR